MTSAKITIEQVASFAAADSYVGAKPSRRWRRASLITTRSDGHSIASWFGAYEPAERVELVRRSLLDVAEWAPLRRVHVPKTSGAGLRALDMPTVADQGRLYLLADPIASHAEHVLSRIAVAFRRGYPLPNVLLAAAVHAKDRPFASVLDIASFFDSAPWDLVDRTIQELPADEHVRELLSSLVRADVMERPSSTRITRNAGLPQGVSLSPSLANLSLHRFDLTLAHRLSSRHVLVRRACDDLLLMGPSRSAVEFGAHAAAEALHRLGFRVKDGTGESSTPASSRSAGSVSRSGGDASPCQTMSSRGRRRRCRQRSTSECSVAMAWSIRWRPYMSTTDGSSLPHMRTRRCRRSRVGW